MDARTGKKIRKGHLFNQNSGRTLIVAYSHGLLMGPGPGLRTLADMRRVTEAVRDADGLMIGPGMLGLLEDAFVGRARPSLILQVDYQSFSRAVLPYEQATTVEIATIEQAVAAGADAVMTYMYMGYADPLRERAEIERNARLARACEKWGMLLMIEPRSAREKSHPEDKTDPDVMGMYCRVAAELGADLVKCIYPGSREAITRIIEGCPVPLLLAGGSKTGDPETAYNRAREAVAAGGGGLVYGRNIYEAEDPAREVARYREIVHGEGA